MIPNLNDIDLAEEHRHNLLREAEALRRADGAAQRIARPARRRPYAPALARLGRLLAAWGARLEALDAPR